MNLGLLQILISGLVIWQLYEPKEQDVHRSWLLMGVRMFGALLIIHLVFLAL